MMDLEALLTADAAQWQRTVDAGAAPGGYPGARAAAGPSRRPRWPAIMLAAAAVVIIAAGAGLVTHLRTDRSARPPALTSRTYDGLTLTFPAAWTVIKPSFLTAAVDYPIAYITNGTASAQCRVGRCGNPVIELGSGQVSISIINETFVSTSYRLTDSVAGRPASVRAGTSAQPECPEHTRQYIFADIALQGRQGDGVRVHACIGADGSTQAAQVRQMLNTARYE